MSRFPGVLLLLWWAVHGVSGSLLLVAVIAAARDGRPAVAVAGLLVGALYAAGPGLTDLLRGRARERLWLVTVTLTWMVLAALSPGFAWLAFPLFFALLYVLPLWAAMFGVTVLTCASVAAASWHAGGVSAPLVLGPTAGAVTAAVMWAGPITGSRSRSRARGRPARPPGA
ncbi:hypothetical protein [Nonomuraea sp. LPB2021202275-12-8]|uniref:hypothetical protein n=1 Tax=Nonomuraea sp. LPB2021202275-12-8 TaxID=3120159 RepID=UPI00300C7C4B